MAREFSEKELKDLEFLRKRKDGTDPLYVQEIKGKDLDDYYVIEKLKYKTKSSWVWYYIIQCKKCKKFKKVASSELKNPRGCQHCQSEQHRTDFIGFENNTYKVLKFDHVDRRRKLYYLCECKNCGSKHVVRKDNIVESTCGRCYNCIGNSKEPSIETVHKRHMDSYIRGAKQRSLIFELTFDQFKDITTKECHYCGSEPVDSKSFHRYNKTKESVKFNGVDRKDSSLGYTLDNVVPCCTKCNKIKMDLKYNEFLNHIEKIHNHIKCASTIPEGSTGKCLEMESTLPTEK
jgi:hypothetical protein